MDIHTITAQGRADVDAALALIPPAIRDRLDYVTIQEVRASGTSEHGCPTITAEDAIACCPFIRYASKEGDPTVNKIADFGQGLFIPEDRTVYFVGGIEPYVLVHELGHALDCALDPDGFVSAVPSTFALSFSARLVVPIYNDLENGQLPTEYACSSPTECWAEAFALWCGATSRFPIHAAQAPIDPRVTTVFAALARGEDVAQPPALLPVELDKALRASLQLHVAAYRAAEKDASS